MPNQIQKRSKSLLIIFASLTTIIVIMIAGFVADYWLDQEDSRLMRLSQNKLKIVATIFPIANQVEKIVGDDGIVYQLVPNSADPHTYSPTPEDILSLSQADAIVYLGDDQEPWVQSLLDGVNNPNIVVIDLSQLKMNSEDNRQDNHEKGNDTEDQEHADEFHYWLDFDLAQQALQMMALELSKSEPNLTEKLAENSQAEQAKWAELDEKYRLGLQNCQTRTVVYAGHSAFEHVAEEYELRWLDALRVSPDAEVAPQTMASLIQALRSEKSLAVFTDVFSPPKLAVTVTEELGLPVLRLNPGERWRYENGQNPEGGLIDIMEVNLARLQEGLGCE